MKKILYNPSTLKVYYEPTNLKLLNCISCPDECDCEYSLTDSPCWSEGETPKYICAKVQGIKKCSDDSLWNGNLVICLEGPINYGSWDYVWYKTITIGEETVTYMYAQNTYLGEVNYVTFLIVSGNLGDLIPRYMVDEAEESACNFNVFTNFGKLDCYPDYTIGYDGGVQIFSPCSGSWP